MWNEDNTVKMLHFEVPLFITVSVHCFRLIAPASRSNVYSRVVMPIMVLLLVFTLYSRNY